MFGITSSTAKLQVGMTLDSINNSNASDKVKKQQIELFNKYNTNPADGRIDEQEFAQYEKDCTKKKWKTAAWIAAGALAVGAIGFGIYKGVQLNKALKQAKEALAGTQQTLSQTEGVLAETEGALTEARQALGYGQGTIKTGDAILKEAVKAETAGGKATFTLAKGTEEFPDLWNKNGTMADYCPSPGMVIMDYGAQPKGYIANKALLAHMEKNGLTEYVDHAISPTEVMYKTYIGQDGRNFLENPLKFGEVVPAKKRIFPAGAAFANPGTTVVTMEAANGVGQNATVGVGQFIQRGVDGEPYVKDINDMFKRINPVESSEESKAVFARVKEFKDARAAVQKTQMSDATKQSAIARLWETALKEIEGIRKAYA